MWNRWVQGWRVCMLTAAAACFLWFVFQNEETAGQILTVCLLFAVLFWGYRFGPGTGAVAGSICGAVLAFWTKEPAQMGILSVLGVFSGAFARLGRLASVTAYMAAAFGAGLMYAPELLFEFMISAMFGGLVFLLLPSRLTAPRKQPAPAQDPAYRMIGDPVGEQLRLAGNAFSVLSGYFADENLASLVREREDGRDWKENYLELRLLFAEQMTECAQMMESIGQGLGESAGLPPDTQKELMRRLEHLGVSAERAVIVRGAKKRGDLYLVMSSKTERCVTMKLVSEAVSEVMGRTMKPDENQSVIVSRSPRMVHFQEEPEYFTLHGVAQSKKEGSGFTGDSFSFLEPDRGGAMFFLCDGMGSGEAAREESSRVTELTELLCRAGFASQTIVRLINNALLIQGKERPVTVDMGRIDLYSGLCDFTKSGAAVTFICRKDAVEELTGDSLPVGILQESAPVERLIRLRPGDMVVMMTDGVLEALPGMDKEEQMKIFCMENRSPKPKEFAARILRYAQSFGAARDDMTVLVAGIWKK